MPFRKHGQYFVGPRFPNIDGFLRLKGSEVSAAKFLSLGKHLDERLCKWGDKVTFIGCHQAKVIDV
jgi:hypothetical protein